MLGATLALGACGGDERPLAATTVKPEEQIDKWTYARGLFNELCGGCHTLADAGATGKRHNLEESGLVTVLDTVSQRVALTRDTILKGQADRHGAGVGMPSWRGVLSTREVEALSLYVGTVVRGPADGE